MNRQHPYKAFVGTPEWKALEQAVADLVENGDLTESTAREYVVGYLAKAVLELKGQQGLAPAPSQQGAEGDPKVYPMPKRRSPAFHPLRSERRKAV